MRALHVVPIALTLVLAGCGDGTGTEISLNVTDPGGAFNATASKDGTVAVNAPGFKGAIKLPKIQLDAGNFDINGVHLPPGSKIDALNIIGSPGDDRVRVTFTSPIAPDAVRAWFQPKLAAKGFRLTATGDALSGTTDEGKPFTLTSKASGTGSESVIAIAD
jgi:hypothetical protein